MLLVHHGIVSLILPRFIKQQNVSLLPKVPVFQQQQLSMSKPREVLGQWMADGIQWADTHRRSLLWGGLLGACSE